MAEPGGGGKERVRVSGGKEERTKQGRSLPKQESVEGGRRARRDGGAPAMAGRPGAHPQPPPGPRGMGSRVVHVARGWCRPASCVSASAHRAPGRCRVSCPTARAPSPRVHVGGHGACLVVAMRKRGPGAGPRGAADDTAHTPCPPAAGTNISAQQQYTGQNRY